MNNPMLKKISAALGRSGIAPIPPRPELLASRTPANLEKEIELFFQELTKLSASGQIIVSEVLKNDLSALVDHYKIQKATLWQTPLIEQLGIARILRSLGVKLVGIDAGKDDLSECDLGITEVDLLLPESGTIVLRASEKKPRVTSLLPRVHLAIAIPSNLRPDLAEALEECKGNGYFVFISGPSRTADIEMTPALGVHGPRELVVWMLDDKKAKAT